MTWIQLFERPFLTNPWLENKSSFFSFSTCIICVLYMPLDPSIKLFMSIEEWWFWFIDIVFWVCHYKVGSNPKQDFKKGFFFFLQTSVIAHLYLLINLIKVSSISGGKWCIYTPILHFLWTWERPNLSVSHSYLKYWWTQMLSTSK